MKMSSFLHPHWRHQWEFTDNGKGGVSRRCPQCGRRRTARNRFGHAQRDHPSEGGMYFPGF
jgi:hypothetical protein